MLGDPPDNTQQKETRKAWDLAEDLLLAKMVELARSPADPLQEKKKQNDTESDQWCEGTGLDCVGDQ